MSIDAFERWLWSRLPTWREAWSEYAELHRRRDLKRRPWEEKILHWSHGPEGWELHGHVPPPDHSRRYGSTPQGWCNAHRESGS